MALLVGGRRAHAERAFEWLVANQRDDGSWHNYYIGNRVEQDKLDANTIAYVATGVWHHWLVRRDAEFLQVAWPAVRRGEDDYGF
jgi:hypothetical protein